MVSETSGEIEGRSSILGRIRELGQLYIVNYTVKLYGICMCCCRSRSRSCEFRSFWDFTSDQIFCGSFMNSNCNVLESQRIWFKKTMSYWEYMECNSFWWCIETEVNRCIGMTLRFCGNSCRWRSCHLKYFPRWVNEIREIIHGMRRRRRWSGGGAREE